MDWKAEINRIDALDTLIDPGREVADAMLAAIRALGDVVIAAWRHGSALPAAVGTPDSIEEAIVGMVRPLAQSAACLDCDRSRVDAEIRRVGAALRECRS